MKVTAIQPEVFVTDAPVVAVDAALIGRVKDAALKSPRRRARFCAHPDNRHPVQEMLIALCRDTYLRPHRHPGKSESFHVIEGRADVLIFGDTGAVERTIQLAPYTDGGLFFYRISTPLFHTMVIHSDMLVIHETTCGPFQPGDCEFAAWAPDEADAGAAAAYMQELRGQAG